MQNLINYVASILNIKIDNPLVITDMEHELQQIEDLAAYREYIRDNFSTVEYATGFQKFIILTNQYKSMQEMANIPMDVASSFSKTLADKVEEARVFLKNELEVGNDKPFSRLKQEGESYFTDKELAALAELGTARYLVELAELKELEDKLIELFVKKYRQKAKYDSLTAGEKKIKGLLS